MENFGHVGNFARGTPYSSSLMTHGGHQRSHKSQQFQFMPYPKAPCQVQRTDQQSSEHEHGAHAAGHYDDFGSHITHVFLIYSVLRDSHGVKVLLLTCTASRGS